MHKICFTVSLFHASTCFEHHVLIARRSEIVSYSLWCHHTETSEWSKITKITKITKIYKYEHIEMHGQQNIKILCHLLSGSLVAQSAQWLGYGLDDHGFEPRQEYKKIFIFSQTIRPIPGASSASYTMSNEVLFPGKVAAA
jgi:hypothetical protein